MCIVAIPLVSQDSRAESTSVLFPSAYIDSARSAQLYWYSPGSSDSVYPTLPDPPVAWLESPPSTAWSAAARIAVPRDSALLYALDLQLKCPAGCGPVAFGLRADTGAPGNALAAIEYKASVLIAANTYRLFLDSPVLLYTPSSYFACIYWSASDLFSLGEADAVMGSTFVAFHHGYVVTRWEPWPDYSLAVSGVFATPYDSDAARVPPGASVAIWRHAIGEADSSFCMTVGVTDRHASDVPPPGRDIEYSWDAGGRRLAAVSVPVAQATALQWADFTAPGSGLKDNSPLTAVLHNWSDSSLSVVIRAQASWCESWVHTGLPPRFEPAEPNFSLLPRHDTSVDFVAHVDADAYGVAVLRIEATDEGPLHARSVCLIDSILAGTTGVDEYQAEHPGSVAPWPNPCRGVLHVPHGTSVELINLLGRRVAEYSAPRGSADVTWDLGPLALPAGVYWLRVQDSRSARVYKLTLLK
jgi:hypothetical protein